MTRREFIARGGVMLAAAGAFAFGEEIGAASAPGTGRTAILYATRYGATRDTAGWIAAGMGGDVKTLDIKKVDVGKIEGNYDRFVIGSGIWIDGPSKALLHYLSEVTRTISPRVIASFVVCGTTDKNDAGRQRLTSYLERINAPLQNPPKLQQAFGGRMIISELTEKDRKLLKNFYEKIVKKPFVDWDRTDPEMAKRFGRILQGESV